jgi:hypothetical protein
MHIEGGNKPTPKSPLTNPPIPRKFKTTHPPTAHTKTMIAENYLWDFVCFYPFTWEEFEKRSIIHYSHGREMAARDTASE